MKFIKEFSPSGSPEVLGRPQSELEMTPSQAFSRLREYLEEGEDFDIEDGHGVVLGRLQFLLLMTGNPEIFKYETHGCYQDYEEVPYTSDISLHIPVEALESEAPLVVHILSTIEGSHDRIVQGQGEFNLVEVLRFAIDARDLSYQSRTEEIDSIIDQLRGLEAIEKGVRNDNRWRVYYWGDNRFNIVEGEVYINTNLGRSGEEEIFGYGSLSKFNAVCDQHNINIE